MNKKLLVIAMAMPALLMIGCGTNESRVASNEMIINEQPEVDAEIMQPQIPNEVMLAMEHEQEIEVVNDQQQIADSEHAVVNENIEVIPEPETMQFYFASNEYELHGDDLAELMQHAKYLANHLDMKVKITGHTDQSGSIEYNQKLAMKRADYVAKFLVKQGVMPEQISIYSQGESQPIAGLEHAIRDRRVEFEYYNELQLSEKQVY